MTGLALPYGNQHLDLRLAAKNILAVASPRPVTPCADPSAEIRRALAAPIGTRPLAQAARGAQRAVILADDLTRQTPVNILVPLLLDELNAAGLCDDQTTVLIALGTHRPMTDAEIALRFGEAVTRRARVLNSPWQDPAQLADLGRTPNGTPIHVCRAAVEADFVIGLGSVVPHHICGFSGGAKIVQPGISSADTTGATHFFSTRTRRSYLGLAENPVRAEMDRIARRAGLKAILNVVLDPAGRLVRALYGEPQAAHRAAITVAQPVYGAPLPGQADIVIASSFPCDLEFWQAHKSLYPADLAVRDGGTIILVTPCPEGVAVTHQDMLDYTALDAPRIETMIETGAIRDVAAGALALAWAKVRERAHVCLVSDGLTPQAARALGFDHRASVDEAVGAALRRHGPESTLTILTHAPDTLPLL
jgi:nickel-dependent lactate racemase